MDSDFTIKTRDDGIQYQVFGGKKYYLYKGERYFSASNKRMHIQVWEHFNGKIPKGFHVHHKDGNTYNNKVDNLTLLSARQHLSTHAKKRFEDDKSFAMEFQRKGQESAKEWHRSEVGKEWHSQHGKHTWVNREYRQFICKQCGDNFFSRHRGTVKFCHNNCKARALRARRKLARKSV